MGRKRGVQRGVQPGQPLPARSLEGMKRAVAEASARSPDSAEEGAPFSPPDRTSAPALPLEPAVHVDQAELAQEARAVPQMLKQEEEALRSLICDSWRSIRFRNLRLREYSRHSSSKDDRGHFLLMVAAREIQDLLRRSKTTARLRRLQSPLLLKPSRVFSHSGGLRGRMGSSPRQRDRVGLVFQCLN